MCGRYALYGPPSRHNREPLKFYGEAIDFAARYNIAPAQALPVYWIDAEHGRRLTLMHWGLVPAWAKDAALGARMNNARAETVAQKPAFRAAYRRRRCLVPMNGFYEWQRSGAHKTPYFVQLHNGELFAVAGLYECWAGNASTPPLVSFAVLTTAANALMQPLHDRMPVIIPPAAYESWLDPDNNSGRGLETLLQPYPADALRAYAVSPRVNNVRNDDATLPEAAAPSAILAPTPLQGQLL